MAAQVIRAECACRQGLRWCRSTARPAWCGPGHGAAGESLLFTCERAWVPHAASVPPCSLALQPCARNRWPSGAGDNATRAAPAVEDSLGKRAAVGQTQAQIHTGHWTPDTVDRWPSKLQHLRRILDLSTPSQKLLAVVWLTTQIRGKIYVYFVVITSRVIGKARAERPTDRGMDSSRPGLSLSSSYVTLTFTPRTDLRTPVLRGAVDDMY